MYTTQLCFYHTCPLTDGLVSIIVAVLCAFALVMVVIRVASHQMRSQSLTGGWDDALVVASWLFAFPLAITAGYLSKLGIGKDIWNFPLDNLTEFLLVIYVEALVYIFAVGVTKIALLVRFPLPHFIKRL